MLLNIINHAFLCMKNYSSRYICFNLQKNSSVIWQEKNTNFVDPNQAKEE
jgi:hypothetical protein